MTRLQPVLSKSEDALVGQMAQLTHSRRTDVIKQALVVYHWFLRQAVTGARVVARSPGGDEVALQTPELAALEGEGQRLGPEELAALARELSTTRDARKAARLRERMTRGFYGI